jgi:hypothetical protein
MSVRSRNFARVSRKIRAQRRAFALKVWRPQVNPDETTGVLRTLTGEVFAYTYR